ncbi:BrnA antitoxin family protein [Desulfonatronum parangueonense]
MSKTVRYEVDLCNLPPLADEQKAELRVLSEMPDNEIDCSDIPPLDDAFWKNAVRNPFYKPTKTSTTVRLDSDVMAWLKSQGKGYQTRMNAILREAMLRSLHNNHKA